ncbi:hypothetical protein CRH09_39660 (plasmid) [Nocardia terpenica]|uniref:Uncharacterized protein n=1 Tax=Nocardia terpenica TaxID=455432 RepID=A0A291RYZ9_9NOCA|nr:hypothetical protein CRH09_39660 [Nocardia terpenica]
MTTDVRVFVLYRTKDLTGYSGVGIVANGVEWPDGRATIRWCVPGKPSSTTDFDSVPDLIDIHGHDGATHVLYVEPVSR